MRKFAKYYSLSVLALAIVVFVGCAKTVNLPPNVSTIPAEIAEQSSFTFGNGDKISVVVYQHTDLNSDLIIAPDGSITLPLVGRLEIAGLSYEEGVAAIESGVHEYYAKATVTVNLVSITSQKVYVVGEVTSPGVLQLTGDMPLFEAVTRAGGINTSAKTKNLLLIRQGEEGGELFMIDLDLLLSGDASQNIAMRAEDILVVPTKTIVQIERFFRQISTILGPFVNTTQVYRNLNMSANTVIEDTPVTTGQ